MARSVKNSAWNEVFALVLLFVGTLLFLALISYTPKDVPSWVWFSHISPANHPAQNFIGPFGAIIAGVCYHLIGAASFLLAAILLGFGAAKLFHSSLRVTPRIAWIVLFVASARVCCNCKRAICRAGKRSSIFKGRAAGSATFLEGRSCSTRWAKSARSFCWREFTCRDADSHDRAAADPLCSRNHRRNGPRLRQTA